MQLTDAQDRVVQAIAASAPAGWERIAADVEILEEGDGYSLDTVALAIVPRDGGYDDPDLEIDRAARDAIAQLYRTLKESGENRTLGSFDLTIDRDGTYKFDFSYDPPKRLNGRWDDAEAERIDNYLQYYLAEKQAG